MAIDQLRRSCTIVLHDDRVSTDDVLCGTSVLPLDTPAKLSVSGGTPLYIRATAACRNHDEVSIHVSLAQRFGLENRATATIEVLEDKGVAAATATHVEFFFRDHHLSRADMWRIMQRLDRTVVYQGQKVSLLGSPVAEVRSVYIHGQEAASAFVTSARTKPIFRSGSARYTILIQVSQEMLEYWLDGDLMYERVVSGFLPELFRRWDMLKVRHQVSVVLFGRQLKDTDSTHVTDFFQVMASDVPSTHWRELLRRLKRAFNGSTLPTQVSLAAKGNMIEAIHLAAMDFSNNKVDPHLDSRGTSVIAITAGAGVIETDHELLKNVTHLLMGNSIGVDIVAMAPKPLHPVPLFSYQRGGKLEYALPHWVDVSFWTGHDPDYATSWRLPQAAGVVNVAIPWLDSKQASAVDMTSSHLDGYDDAVFGSENALVMAANPAALLAGANHNALLSAQDHLLLKAEIKGKETVHVTSDQDIQQPDTLSPAKVKRSDRAVLPSHSLMASGRKISLGPKGLAPGRGLASTTLSVQHAQHERDLVANAPFSPDESSSEIAKQIRKSLARKPSQQSITKPSSRAPIATTKPINIQPTQQFATSDEADPASMIEQAVLETASESYIARAAGISDTPTAKNDLFYTAMKAAEEGGHWKASPWLTLLNPSHCTKDNMRVAAQYRKWQHIFPRAVSPTEFKWPSMCSPAVLPLTAEYKPSVRELERHFVKRVRRLLVPQGADHGHISGRLALMQLAKLRLIYGFQITTTEHTQAVYGLPNHSDRMLMSLGNVYHELQSLSDAELQVVEYSLNSSNKDSAKDEVADEVYRTRMRSAVDTKAIRADIQLRVVRPEIAWSRLDEQIIVHDSSRLDRDVTRMRFVLIPVEPPRPGHVTPGPARGLSDEERHIDGIQKLTQLWQRNRYVVPQDRRQQASLPRSKITPQVAPRDPNPLAIEYQTRDPSAVVNAYGPALSGQGDISEEIAPLFAESELYHSSSFDTAKLVKQMQEPPPHGVEVRDRRWFARLHFKCFRGDEMVNWLLRVFRDLQTREDAIAIGKELMDRGIFSHVRAKHEFRDGNYFYQIAGVHRTTEYPDNASVFGRGSLRSMPPTPVGEVKASPMMRALREDGASSGKLTPTTMPAGKRHVLLSERMLYNVDPGKKSDQLEIISLHYDRIHNPENCYHILLEWVNTTATLVREATTRWTTLAETHGLKLVQVPTAEVSKLQMQHPFDQSVLVRLAMRPPEKIPVTPALNAQIFGMQSVDDSLAYHKALLRKMDFVLDFEAASSFTARLDVQYSYGKPDYAMTQFIHKSGLLQAQVCGDEKCDFLLLPNRLASSGASMASRLFEVEPVEAIVTRFVDVCRDEKALRAFYEDTNKPRLPPPSPLGAEDFGLDNDVPPIQLPPRVTHRAAMRMVL